MNKKEGMMVALNSDPDVYAFIPKPYILPDYDVGTFVFAKIGDKEIQGEITTLTVTAVCNKQTEEVTSSVIYTVEDDDTGECIEVLPNEINYFYPETNGFSAEYYEDDE